MASLFKVFQHPQGQRSTRRYCRSAAEGRGDDRRTRGRPRVLRRAESLVFVSPRPARCFVPEAALCWPSAPCWPSSPSSCPAEAARGGSAPWLDTCRWLQVGGEASSPRAAMEALKTSSDARDLGFLLLQISRDPPWTNRCFLGELMSITDKNGKNPQS